MFNIFLTCDHKMSDYQTKKTSSPRRFQAFLDEILCGSLCRHVTVWLADPSEKMHFFIHLFFARAAAKCGSSDTRQRSFTVSVEVSSLFIVSCSLRTLRMSHTHTHTHHSH